MKRIILLAMSAIMMAACQQSLEDKCATEARRYTQRNCPAQLDEFTIMDSMTFDRTTHTLHYYYRFTGRADREDLKTDELSTALLDALKNMTSMKAYKDAGYTFDYIYRSQKNPRQVLLQATFTKDDYQ